MVSAYDNNSANVIHEKQQSKISFAHYIETSNPKQAGNPIVLLNISLLY
jgi:hypothetical protein